MFIFKGDCPIRGAQFFRRLIPLCILGHRMGNPEMDGTTLCSLLSSPPSLPLQETLENLFRKEEELPSE